MSAHRKRNPIRRPAAVVLTVSMLVLAGCGDDDTEATGQGGEPETTGESPDAGESDDTTADGAPGDTAEDTSETSETTETTAAGGPVVDVTVAGGEVTGGGRHQVDLGETVTIRVTSDVSDHVHLHGYDVLADVAAGETAELVFDATIPGVFEVELEDAGLPLLELEVS